MEFRSLGHGTWQLAPSSLANEFRPEIRTLLTWARVVEYEFQNRTPNKKRYSFNEKVRGFHGCIYTYYIIIYIIYIYTSYLYIYIIIRVFLAWQFVAILWFDVVEKGSIIFVAPLWPLFWWRGWRAEQAGHSSVWIWQFESRRLAAKVCQKKSVFPSHVFQVLQMCPDFDQKADV
jgi:hypothetical protein